MYEMYPESVQPNLKISRTCQIFSVQKFWHRGYLEQSSPKNVGKVRYNLTIYVNNTLLLVLAVREFDRRFLGYYAWSLIATSHVKSPCDGLVNSKETNHPSKLAGLALYKLWMFRQCLHFERIGEVWTVVTQYPKQKATIFCARKKTRSKHLTSLGNRESKKRTLKSYS